MNVDTSGEQLTEWETKLRDALVDEVGLSVEAIECIVQAAAATRLGFADAALDLGLVTRQQVEAAIEQLRNSQGRPASTTASSASMSTSVALAPRSPDIEHPYPARVATPGIPGPDLSEVLDPYSARGELIRALRTELLLNSIGGENRNGLLAILSAEPGEGRTQLAAELAISFAQLGRRTLLVDADLRSPRQSAMFGSSNEWGIAQAMAFGEQPTPQPIEGLRELSLLVAGTVMPNPMEMLTDPNFHRMVALWKLEYEFVIFDTPPISRFADGLLLAKLTGRVLLLARANHTRQAAVKDTLRRLAGTRAEIVGSVINQF